jgi:ubiquitin-conjugating enzyme E2 variant
VGADFFSGLVHWAFDTWGERTTPVLGPTFIVPFRVHHDDPKDITRHGFVATNGHNCLATAPVLGATLLLSPDWAGATVVQAFALALCFGVFLTNQFHKWSHQDAPSPVVAWLQRHHLVLPPDHHEVHHTAPYARHYCITTGWLNPVLEAVGFFRGMERLVIRVTGATPRRDDLAGKLL